MKNIIKKGFCLLVLLMGMQQLLAEKAVFLIFEMKTGATYSFLLSEYPVITFDDEHTIVNSDIASTYVTDEIDNYHFVEREISRIEPIKKDEIRFAYLDRSNVNIYGLKNGQEVQLFNLSGLLLKKEIATSETLTVNLPEKKGIYILKIGNLSVKVIKS